MELFQKSGKAFPVFVEGVDVACSCSGCTDLLYSLAFTRAMVRLQEVQSQCQGPVCRRCSMTVTTSLPSQWPISFLLPGFWSGNKCYVMWLGHSTTAHQGYSWEPWTHWTCVLLKTSGTHNLWAFYNNQLKLYFLGRPPLPKEVDSHFDGWTACYVVPCFEICYMPLL